MDRARRFDDYRRIGILEERSDQWGILAAKGDHGRQTHRRGSVVRQRPQSFRWCDRCQGQVPRVSQGRIARGMTGNGIDDLVERICVAKFGQAHQGEVDDAGGGIAQRLPDQGEQFCVPGLPDQMHCLGAQLRIVGDRRCAQHCGEGMAMLWMQPRAMLQSPQPV